MREVHEETGVDIEEVRFLGVTNDVFEVEARHYITLWFEAQYLSGVASVAAEHEMSEVQWCPSTSLPSKLFLSLRHLVDGESLGVERSRLASFAVLESEGESR